jgi:hypothetical protein
VPSTADAIFYLWLLVRFIFNLFGDRAARSRSPQPAAAFSVTNIQQTKKQCIPPKKTQKLLLVGQYYQPQLP